MRSVTGQQVENAPIAGSQHRHALIGKFRFLERYLGCSDERLGLEQCPFFFRFEQQLLLESVPTKQQCLLFSDQKLLPAL